MSVFEVISNLKRYDDHEVGVLVQTDNDEAGHFMPITNIKLRDIKGRRYVVIGELESRSNVVVRLDGEPAL